MINKKIILGLLTIGMLACVASAGTYAYFQDQITSTNNGVTVADFGFTVDGAATTNGVGTVAGVTIDGAVPGISGTVKSYTIANTGDIAGDVYAKIKPAAGFNANMKIYVDGKLMTGDQINVQEDLSGSYTSTITYTYANTNSNQYDEEGKTTSFDIVYTFVQDGATPQ